MDIFTNMSDLQLSLIIIGAIIIAGVAIFNWIQQQRYQRRVQAAFEYKHDDVLLDADSDDSISERIEPVFNKSSLHESDAYHSHAQDIRKNAPISPTPSTAPSNTATSNSAMPTSVLLDYDNATNYIVNIRSDSPIANTYIAKLLQRKFDFGKTVAWLGQRNSDEPWEEITNEANIESDGYRHIKGCLQLADRAGAISEVNLSKFRDLVEEFASQIQATAECPDIVSTHEKAVTLDKFCVDVDVMIGINIISKDDGAFVGTKIRALAEASGFKLDADGVFKYRDDNNHVLFTLSNYESSPFLPENMRSLNTHGVTFLLDVPRVAHGERIFDQMTHLAKIFSNTLGGIIVDDNRVPLSESGLQRSKQQLIDIQSAMKRNHIHAGSASALRLFV
ncbi:cell division protein ZipA, interacts with FtsZ [Nitrosomonas sp. PY1]|uniref:cell division protein ZipA C-terminal FtsZ-binding domain-containing protein n=1 Tax=Nitrosomonas sp. PY1 TaxID=1803906 RepID=UPI001FC8163D|nr:cell division protein ZipA C-terminal FtsZ-binding domain-containing protein [Nitrosomonas sp. PY1]GKS70158.1 cell division protein ZipA, interacts with FtsZ [Nitrosomonas sp. PY1]